MTDDRERLEHFLEWRRATGRTPRARLRPRLRFGGAVAVLGIVALVVVAWLRGDLPGPGEQVATVPPPAAPAAPVALPEPPPEPTSRQARPAPSRERRAASIASPNSELPAREPELPPRPARLAGAPDDRLELAPPVATLPPARREASAPTHEPLRTRAPEPIARPTPPPRLEPPAAPSPPTAPPPAALPPPTPPPATPPPRVAAPPRVAVDPPSPAASPSPTTSRRPETLGQWIDGEIGEFHDGVKRGIDQVREGYGKVRDFFRRRDGRSQPR